MASYKMKPGFHTLNDTGIHTIDLDVLLMLQCGFN